MREIKRPMTKEEKLELMQVEGWFDAQCKYCGRKIGWYGKITDKPKCVCGVGKSNQQDKGVSK